MNRRTFAAACGGGAALLVPWMLVTAYTLNFYYRSGSATLLDSGWFVALVTHGSGLALPNPAVILPGSFYAVHMSPLLALLRLLHDAVWPGPDAAWFAVCQGVWYGVIGLSVWIAVRPSAPVLALPTAISTALGGAALATLGFPHFEVAIPALLTLFLVLFGAARRWWALPLLLLLAGVREDGGLHAASIIGLVGLHFAQQRRNHPTSPALVFLALAALLIAAAALSAFVHAHYFGDGPSALHGTYLRRPPLAHLSAAFLAGRIADLAAYRSYIFVPIVVVLATALATRDGLLALGPLSSAGWLSLTLIAHMQQAGQLWNYFGFPFMFVLAWPAVCLALRDGSRPRLAWLQLTTSILSIALFTISGRNTDPRPWLHAVPPGWRTIGRTEAAITAILGEQPLWPHLVVDDAVGSLRANAFSHQQLHVQFQHDVAQDAQADALFGTVIPPAYLAQRQAGMIAASHLAYAYIVPGTMLILRTRAAIPAATLADLRMVPAP